jgi:class 3 adenylate cyclase
MHEALAERARRAARAVRHALPALSAVSTGLLTGAMLFIGLSVASWLRDLSPDELNAWIWSYGLPMRRVMLPMGLLSTLLAGLALALGWRASAACRRRLLLASVCLLTASGLEVAGVEPIEPALAAPLVFSNRQEAALLGRELAWHWARVGLALTAFLATLSGLRRGEKEREARAQRERLNRLKRFFSPHLAELIVAGDTADPLQSHRREVTVVFLDLRGFTAFAEAEPEQVMDVLREYHAELGPLVLAWEGTLERFTGDGMMIFFNDPIPVPNPAERAVRMAVAMRERVDALRAGWRRRGFELDFGVGIAQGDATLGAIGFEGRWDYGAIGTVTNVANRLCAEALPGQILISAPVLAGLDGLVEAEPIGDLVLKGLSRPVPAFNVRGLRAETRDNTR